MPQLVFMSMTSFRMESSETRLTFAKSVAFISVLSLDMHPTEVFFFFYEWEQNGHNVPFLQYVSLTKRERKTLTRM